ncbi:hypothetical protein ACFL2J_07885, partial [Candidatus Omnitrophota bacterium]
MAKNRATLNLDYELRGNQQKEHYAYLKHSAQMNLRQYNTLENSAGIREDFQSVFCNLLKFCKNFRVHRLGTIIYTLEMSSLGTCVESTLV